ncbi:MAG: sulfate ABC transporter substrate-binding protein, partial [Rhodobacteraceae bacterium]|nr:sulfate ABC transporter substrate-binding protein [Paracoccaceae bacterium]
LAVKLETWLTSQRAAEIINAYTIDNQILFTFNAK